LLLWKILCVTADELHTLHNKIYTIIFKLQFIDSLLFCLTAFI